MSRIFMLSLLFMASSAFADAGQLLGKWTSTVCDADNQNMTIEFLAGGTGTVTLAAYQGANCTGAAVTAGIPMKYQATDTELTAELMAGEIINKIKGHYKITNDELNLEVTEVWEDGQQQDVEPGAVPTSFKRTVTP